MSMHLSSQLLRIEDDPTPVVLRLERNDSLIMERTIHLFSVCKLLAKKTSAGCACSEIFDLNLVWHPSTLGNRISL